MVLPPRPKQYTHGEEHKNTQKVFKWVNPIHTYKGELNKMKESQRIPIDFKKEITEKLQNQRSHSHTELDKKTFRASSVGYCPRHILLNKLGVKKHDAETLGRFQTGDFIHDWIQKEILPSYATKHEEQVIIELDNGAEIVGHYDCLDPVEGIVYDFKSRASWYRFNLPIERHLQQLEVYMRAANLKDPRGMMVYVSKSDLTVESYPDFFGESEERGDISEHNILLETSDERWSDIKDKVKRVKSSLHRKGFPTSTEDVNERFKPCGDCVGCKFEDSSKWDFSHVVSFVNSRGDQV